MDPKNYKWPAIWKRLLARKSVRFGLKEFILFIGSFAFFCISVQNNWKSDEKQKRRESDTEIFPFLGLRTVHTETSTTVWPENTQEYERKFRTSYDTKFGVVRSSKNETPVFRDQEKKKSQKKRRACFFSTVLQVQKKLRG